MLDKIKWKIHWNKKLILRSTAIAAVPLLGVSAFLGYWFMQPTEQVQDEPPGEDNPPPGEDNPPPEEEPGYGDDPTTQPPLEPNEPIYAFSVTNVSWISNNQILVDYEYSSYLSYIDQVVVNYGYDGIMILDELSKDPNESYFIIENVPQEIDINIDIRVEYNNDFTEYEDTEYVLWQDNPGYYTPKPVDDPEWIPGNPQTPSNPEEPGDIVPPVQEIYAFEITDVYWFSNKQIYLDYHFTSNPMYVDQVIIEYGYDGVFIADEITTNQTESYFILNDVPQETDIDINVRVEYTNGHIEYEETEYVLWQDNPGYYTPKPDDPEYIPGNPTEPSDPEDPIEIKDPLSSTPINPISTVDFYPATNSQGEFNQSYIETILISNFEDMIDYSAPGVSPDSEYDLYYELVDPYTLNVMIVETINGQVLNETKFTYSIV